MRLLVTGAAGYCGPALVEVLGREHWLRCTTFHTKMEPPANGEVVQVDLSRFADAEALVQGIDAVVHSAAVAQKMGEHPNPEGPMKSTVVGTANLLEAAHRAGIKRFVLVSSGAVITGYSRDTYIHAGLPHKFKGLYCLTKSLQERIAMQYAEEYGMVIPCLRPWSVVDGRTFTYASGQPIRKGDGAYFGLVCRYDLAEACRLALTAPLEGFQAFHIMVTEPGRRWFDVDRTERLLGWKPAVSFAQFSPDQQ